MDSVTAVLLERGRGPQGLGTTAVFSVGIHVLVAIALIVSPGRWLTPHLGQEPTPVMSISLGGSPGPQAGGMNMMGGRPVQQAAPEADTRPQPVRPPAARTPEMTMPVPDAKAKPSRERAPAPEIRNAPEEARGRTPTTGPQERFGSTIADTGAIGLGLGISTGGGGTGGVFDVGNFCCPDYLSLMLRKIQENWNSRQPVAGATVMKFTIQRNGRVTDVGVERSSGYAMLDLTAQRALVTTQLPPLPAAYTNPTLTILLTFNYQR